MSENTGKQVVDEDDLITVRSSLFEFERDVCREPREHLSRAPRTFLLLSLRKSEREREVQSVHLLDLFITLQTHTHTTVHVGKSMKLMETSESSKSNLLL